MTGPALAPTPPPGPPVLAPFAAYSPYAWLLPQELWDKRKRFYIYQVDWVTPNQLPATGGTNVTRTFNVERDSTFACINISVQVTNTDNVTFVASPSILVSAREAGSGLELFSSPVPMLNLFNAAGGAAADKNLNYLALPRIFSPAATVSITLENLDATARHIRMSWIGFRVYGP